MLQPWYSLVGPSLAGADWAASYRSFWRASPLSAEPTRASQSETAARRSHSERREEDWRG